MIWGYPHLEMDDLGGTPIYRNPHIRTNEKTYTKETETNLGTCQVQQRQKFQCPIGKSSGPGGFRVPVPIQKVIDPSYLVHLGRVNLPILYSRHHQFWGLRRDSPIAEVFCEYVHL